jgi:hypothetical protein
LVLPFEQRHSVFEGLAKAPALAVGNGAKGGYGFGPGFQGSPHDLFKTAR